MLRKFKQVFRKTFQNGELNLLTLHIRDPEIRKRYQLQRALSFAQMLKPSMLISIVQIPYLVISLLVVQDDFKFYKVDKAILFAFVNLAWFLLNKYCQKYAPLIVFAPIFFNLIYFLLSANEWMPYEVDEENNITTANATAFVILIFNRCSFLQTLLIQPPLYLISYYFALRSEAKFMIDPENNERFDSDQQNKYVNGRMVLCLGVVIASTINQYIYQLDIASLVIQNEKTERQNTQLQQFFQESSDAVAIVANINSQPQLVLCN